VDGGGLWHAPAWQSLPALPGAELRLALDVLCDPAGLLNTLRAEIAWEQHHVRLFGRVIPSPRLSCWIGDADAVYSYSGLRFTPRPWTSTLAALRTGLVEICAADFNSVLANLYRDGRDSMGWHSDDEPELGPAPVIASLSLGETRRFRLRHRQDPAQRLDLDLPSGSLLLMAGTTQRHYRHDLPRAPRVQGARLNLTFRHITPRWP
jgi:alkylated DNA repair dioxygenase AlkB